MTDFNSNTTAELWTEARQCTLKLSHPTPTTTLLEWTLPANRTIINGFVIILAEKILNISNSPTDGERYTPSLDFSSPADVISNAVVVEAKYEIFGDTVANTGSITVINTDPNKIYYAGIYACSNILQYYTQGIQSYPLESARLDKRSDSFAGALPVSEGPPLNPSLGQVYYDPSTNIVSMWTGSIWIPASTGTVKTGTQNDRPTSPSQGEFFYNINSKQLEIWNGTSWVQADTSQEGTPIYDRIGVGTDGSYDERLRLANVLKHQLGWPAVCVELNEDHFNIAIDNAIEEFRRRADNAYQRRHIIFELKKDQAIYYLNDPVYKTDRIVDIIKIHRVNTLGLSGLGGDASVYAQIFFNQFYQSGIIDILSIHLMQSLAEEYERIFAGNLMYDWDEASRQLTILRKIYRDEKVVLECIMERTEQELLVDRWAKQWLQAWAESELMVMLGQIRSKYSSGLPGPNGGITLNGSELLAQATEMQSELLRQLSDYEVGNGGFEFGNCSFVIG